MLNPPPSNSLECVQHRVAGPDVILCIPVSDEEPNASVCPVYPEELRPNQRGSPLWSGFFPCNAVPGNHMTVLSLCRCLERPSRLLRSDYAVLGDRSRSVTAGRILRRLRITAVTRCPRSKRLVSRDGAEHGPASESLPKLRAAIVS